MGAKGSGRKPTHAPDEAAGTVRDIINIDNEGNSNYYLVKYSEEDLNEARLILRKHNIRISLRKAIEAELKMRTESRTRHKGTNEALARWFEPLWLAVQSLFFKGPYAGRCKDPEVKAALAMIKKECAGDGGA